MSNLKERLDEASEARMDSGMIHYGYIHHIQQETSDNSELPVLKAAIYQVLEAVPEIFPEDLPEQVEAGKVERLTDEQAEALGSINETLIIPLYPGEVVDIIRSAKNYLRGDA